MEEYTRHLIEKPLAFEKRCHYASVVATENDDVFAYISNADSPESHKEAVNKFRQGLSTYFPVREYKFGVYGNLSLEQKNQTAIHFCKGILGLTIL